MNYIAEDFHLHYIPSYALYVYSDLFHDNLMVINEENEIIVYISYSSNNPTTEASKILALPFPRVNICLPQHRLILVPSEVFDPNDIDLYADYFVEDRLDKIDYTSIPKIGVTGVYQYNSIIRNKWFNVFPMATIVPVFEPVVHQAIAQGDDEGLLLRVHIYGDRADMCLFMDGQIRIYNTFEVQTVDDLSYFVISLFKNFGIENRVQKILLSGSRLDSEWGQRLSLYTENIALVNPNKAWKCTNYEVLEDVQKFYFLSDLAVCE